MEKLINKYYVRFHISAWRTDGFMMTLMPQFSLPDKETAIERAKQYLKKSGLNYVKADIVLMYYDSNDYNYKDEHVWIMEGGEK